MMWQGIDGRAMSISQFEAHAANIRFDDTFRPSLIVVHNTANPSLNPLPNHGSWHGSATSPEKRVNESLVKYYRDQQGWSGGPHAFIEDRPEAAVHLFTPLNKRGTHSPSWNGFALGFEMVGDYDLEAFDSGPGADVRDNAVAVVAIMCAKLGLNPDTAIKMHYEDPKTTHACPGKHVIKSNFVGRVREYMAHGGGEHTVADETIAPAIMAKPGTVDVDDLNVRALSSVSAAVVAKLKKGDHVTVISDTMNGDTRWFKIVAPDGWVSARFITI